MEKWEKEINGKKNLYVYFIKFIITFFFKDVKSRIMNSSQGKSQSLSYDEKHFYTNKLESISQENSDLKA